MTEALPPKDCYCPREPPCDCVLCKVCGESWTANDDGMCRECNIEKLLEDWPCCPCGARLYNLTAFRSLGEDVRQPHAPTCPHEETGAYDAEDDNPRPLDPLQAAWAAGYRAGVASAAMAQPSKEGAEKR